MTSEERDLITGLFNRLRTADSNNQTPKDQDASQLIGQLTGQQPSAPYLLVQTLLVQEHALNNATGRIRQLEQQVQQAAAAAKPAASSGGFLSGLFGHSAQPAQPEQTGVQQGKLPPPMPAQAAGYAPQAGGYAPQGQQQPPPPYPTTANMPPSAGGGFLKGALGTAAGVAGGALLFQGISNLLGHNSGPFGGMGGFGGGGGGHLFGGSGQPETIERNETINNYYDRDPNQGGVGESGGFLGAADDQNSGDANSGGSFNDAGFDNNNPFAKDDSFGLGTGAGAGGSLDNNYDPANTDANDSGGLFSGGGDDNNSGSDFDTSNDFDSGSDFGGGSDDSNA